MFIPFSFRLPGQLAKFRVCICNAAQSGWDVAGSLRAIVKQAWPLGLGVAAIRVSSRSWRGRHRIKVRTPGNSQVGPLPIN